MEDPQNGTSKPQGRFYSDLPWLSLFVPDSLSLNWICVGTCRFLREDRLKRARAVPFDCAQANSKDSYEPTLPRTHQNSL